MCDHTQDRIDAYLRGEMDDKLRMSFENDLEKDMRLRKDFIETKAISNAIADRAEKLDRMAAWDNQEQAYAKNRFKKSAIRRLTIGFSIAACIAVAFFTLIPGPHPFHAEIPPMADAEPETYYRSGGNGYPEISSLIASGKYGVALHMVDSLIADGEIVARSYDSKGTLTDKEEYGLMLLEERLYGLNWQRIKLLVALEKTSEARDALKRFVMKEGEHKTEADSLLQVL